MAGDSYLSDKVEDQLVQLASRLKGELLRDDLHRQLYATDASVYRMLPLAVAYPRDEDDLKELASYCNSSNIPLIPRAAGTSLAGQCVGEGIVVDVSKHMTAILSLDVENRTVTVQPGVIRDELNRFLEPYGLYFGPNTSTSNRCMMGGMVGNNSSGTTSIRYGVTRDKVHSIRGVLADGSSAVFSEISNEQLESKSAKPGLEGRIYKLLLSELSKSEVRKEIRTHFPKSGIHRRNTGYALDSLLECQPFNASGPPLNLARLLCGSEGTLALMSEITLKLDELPPPERALFAVHYSDIQKCLQDVLVAMQHELHTCELVDDTILNCTGNNRKYDAYRFFIQGTPKALLMLEMRGQTPQQLQRLTTDLNTALEASGRSYSRVLLKGSDIEKALELRKAGLGLLGNMAGDAKAVACIEDTAVALEDLPNYIAEFEALMKSHGQKAVYYAHAGAGELHLRPILNLKDPKGVRMFRQLTAEVANLVKKYRGSLSGEHGDGIVRGEFLPKMIGDSNYRLLKRIKNSFDPKGILNPGKIIDAWDMDKNLRYKAGREEPEVPTLTDFSPEQGVLRLVENCNGSGDCRKTAESGATMCPSYQATLDEKDSTRGRANVLREILTSNPAANRFDSEEIWEVLDLCLSCKACSSECPSNVNIAAVKSEFLHQYRQIHGAKLKDRIFANSTDLNQFLGRFPGLVNFLYRWNPSAALIKGLGGMAQERSLPKLSPASVRNKIRRAAGEKTGALGRLVLFVDEFSQYLDAGIAVDSAQLLNRLGYEVQIVDHLDSARALLSKGYLDKAQRRIDRCVEALFPLVSEDAPLVGIEPSAILGFRDEFIRLASDKEKAREIARHTYLLEEYISEQAAMGNIGPEAFTKSHKAIKIHVHCHQKALSTTKAVFDVLNLPENYRPTIITSGCCGMAGSFGYEKDHYKLSMQIGELKLFPSVRKTKEEVIIAASGTSCRHQIADGTGRQAQHSATILNQALL